MSLTLRQILRIASLSFFGVLITLLGVFCYLFMPVIIQKQIVQELIIAPDRDSFSNWLVAPIPIHQRFYFFNITNPHEVFKTQKPRLHEVGPFTFLEKRKKTNLTWDETKGTVGYNQMRSWFYEEDLSMGNLSSSLFHINPPLVSSQQRIATEPKENQEFMYNAVNDLREETDLPLVMRHMVRELLFEGYEDPLLIVGQAIGLSPVSRFGWMYDKNNSAFDGTYRVFSGQSGTDEKLGLMESWNSQTRVGVWDSPCGKTDDSSPDGMWPPFPENVPLQIRVFVGDLCRAITLHLEREVELKGVKLNRYVADGTLFDYSIPENKCYCDRGGCPKNGAMSLFRCHSGSIAVSFPHFLHSDPSYGEAVEGLRPALRNHSFYMDLEPSLNIVVRTSARVQMNIHVTNSQQFNLTQSNHYSDLYVPAFWSSTDAELNDEMLDKLRLIQQKVPYIISLTSFFMLIFGGSLLTMLLIYVLKITKYKKMIEKRRIQYHSVKMASTNFD